MDTTVSTLPPDDDHDAPRPRWVGVLIVVMMVLITLGVVNVGWRILQNSPAEEAQAQRVSADPELQRGLALAQASDCARCHMVDRKAVGPGYVAIAERYAGQADAVSLLAGKIRSGSVGTWGTVIMPRHPQISDVDATLIARWVLSHAEAGKS